MVETETLYSKGIKTGAIDEDAIMVGIKQGWKVMEAPSKKSTKAYSMIFWEPLNAEDQELMADKVVFIYYLLFMIILL
jgi:hypothetical protein